MSFPSVGVAARRLLSISTHSSLFLLPPHHPAWNEHSVTVHDDKVVESQSSHVLLLLAIYTQASRHPDAAAFAVKSVKLLPLLIHAACF
mmetsp:Transcript_20008/g.49726  ORF Transcript_20008/g.49726 Transcript_20008/m.49726 type:complete len:89 (-) Transcript_20008:190-456(-)